VPVFLGLRLAAAAGNAQAAHLAATSGRRLIRRRLGARHRPRLDPAAGAVATVTLGAVLGGLAVVAVTYHRLCDVRHLISATLVVAALAARAALITPRARHHNGPADRNPPAPHPLSAD
jgi:hypothetical protein